MLDMFGMIHKYDTKNTYSLSVKDIQGKSATAGIRFSAVHSPFINPYNQDMVKVTLYLYRY
jgi:hypothetical protein